jgi:hypothetical protein
MLWMILPAVWGLALIGVYSMCRIPQPPVPGMRDRKHRRGFLGRSFPQPFHPHPFSAWGLKVVIKTDSRLG